MACSNPRIHVVLCGCHLMWWLIIFEVNRSEWPPQGCHYRWLIRLAFDTTSPLVSTFPPSPILPSRCHPSFIRLTFYQLLTSNNHKSSDTRKKARAVQHIALRELQRTQHAFLKLCPHRQS